MIFPLLLPLLPQAASSSALTSKSETKAVPAHFTGMCPTSSALPTESESKASLPASFFVCALALPSDSEPNSGWRPRSVGAQSPATPADANRATVQRNMWNCNGGEARLMVASSSSSRSDEAPQFDLGVDSQLSTCSYD